MGYGLNEKASNYGPKNGKLYALDYRAVEFTEGAMKKAFERDYRYYANLNVDDMLFELRKKAGIAVLRGKSLAKEEESWFHLGANVLGQWLQAFARFYRSTGRTEMREKAASLVAGLQEIAVHSPCFYDGLGMYYFEKYLRGLTDCWLLCDIPAAYELAEGLLHAAMNSGLYQNAKLFLGDNGPGDEIEWYTIPESILYFADACEREKGKNAEAYRAFAKKFAYFCYWDIFANGENLHDYSPLNGQNTAYFHAYSHLNTLNSAAYFYQITGDAYYLDVIEKCYGWFKNKQAVPTGGYGTHTEWLMPRTGIVNALHNFHDNFETQCNAYAVYRVGNFLLTHTGEAAYADWSERLIWNATLASCPIDEAGHTFYYSDYNVNFSKKYLHPNTWTCCTGSRPLLLNELKRSIYFYDEKNVYVAQYLSSEAEINGLRLSQKAVFGEAMNVELTVQTSEPRKCGICCRLPDWVTEKPDVQVNGKATVCKAKNGWMVINGVWKTGDRIVLSFPMKLRTERIVSKGWGVSSAMAGPVCLAIDGDRSGTVIASSENIAAETEYAAPMHYRLKADRETVLRPFYEYALDEPYHLFYSVREKRDK